jgi:hypothetical protein
MGSDRGQRGVPGDERSGEGLGQGNIGGIVRGHVPTQFPDPGQEQPVRITRERKIGEILEHLSTPTGIHVTRECISAEDLGNLQVQEVRRVKRLTRFEDAGGHPGTVRRIEQNLEKGRGVDDEHESASLSLGPHGPGRGDTRDDRGTPGQTLAQFSHRGALGHAPHFLKKVVRQRESLQGRAGLELSMELVGNVAELDHFRHVSNIASCGGACQ